MTIHGRLDKHLTGTLAGSFFTGYKLCPGNVRTGRQSTNTKLQDSTFFGGRRLSLLRVSTLAGSYFVIFTVYTTCPGHGRKPVDSNVICVSSTNIKLQQQYLLLWPLDPRQSTDSNRIYVSTHMRLPYLCCDHLIRLSIDSNGICYVSAFMKLNVPFFFLFFCDLLKRQSIDSKTVQFRLVSTNMKNLHTFLVAVS